jgi:hypothetical protein
VPVKEFTIFGLDGYVFMAIILIIVLIAAFFTSTTFMSRSRKRRVEIIEPTGKDKTSL